jgi:hypothetical protein
MIYWTIYVSCSTVVKEFDQRTIHESRIQLYSENIYIANETETFLENWKLRRDEDIFRRNSNQRSKKKRNETKLTWKWKWKELK